MRTIFLFLLFSLLTSPAYAYLDPGSSSMLLSTIIALITVGIFVSKKFLYEKLGVFGKKGALFDTKREYHIVVYSEGGQYWNVFLPVLEELDSRGESIIYLTSSQSDPGLKHSFTNVESVYIGEGHQAFYILNNLKASLVFLTTPGLDVLQIKRSKNVKHYCFITHSAGNCGRYKAHGIDYVDSVLVGGTADRDDIIELENKRNTPKKKIEIVGCTYLDVLRKRLNESSLEYTLFPEKRTTILLSPTWGKHGLLAKYGSKVLDTLVSMDEYNLIIRPHPQSFISEKDLMESLVNQYPDSGRLKWDRENDGLIAMFHADIMISDFSGIIYDYLFLFQRPVLTFQAHFEKRGRDAMDLDNDLFEMAYLEKIGKVLSDNDIAGLTGIIAENLDTSNDLTSAIEVAQEALAQHPGKAGKNAADFIQSVIQQD